MIYALLLRYVWYIVGFVAVLAFLGGLYLYVFNKGRDYQNTKILKQTERIVKDRVKTDEKVNRLTDDAVRSELRRWVSDAPGGTD